MKLSSWDGRCPLMEEEDRMGRATTIPINNGGEEEKG